MIVFFFFNDTATTEIYTLSLHDALPILGLPSAAKPTASNRCAPGAMSAGMSRRPVPRPFSSTRKAPTILVSDDSRSEEHTSELQSRQYLVCRLLLEKKKKILIRIHQYKE